MILTLGIEISLKKKKKIYGSKTVLAWTAITNYRKIGGLNKRYSFLTVLEAGEPNIKVPVASVSGKSLLPHL